MRDIDDGLYHLVAIPDDDDGSELVRGSDRMDLADALRMSKWMSHNYPGFTYCIELHQETGDSVDD